MPKYLLFVEDDLWDHDILVTDFRGAFDTELEAIRDYEQKFLPRSGDLPPAALIATFDGEELIPVIRRENFEGQEKPYLPGWVYAEDAP